MGWFDGASEVGSSHSHHSHHKSHSGSGKRHSSGSSIFGLGDDKHGTRHNNSSRSFLNFAAGNTGRSSSSSSYYKRSPRKGYLNKMYAQARRLFRDLLYYLKKNPLKVFMLVIMPLITGGLLTGLLAKFGIRLPPSVHRMLAQMGGGSRIGGRRGGEFSFERESYEGPLGGLGSIVGAVGGLGGLGTAFSMAKMFM